MKIGEITIQLRRYCLSNTIHHLPLVLARRIFIGKTIEMKSDGSACKTSVAHETSPIVIILWNSSFNARGRESGRYLTNSLVHCLIWKRKKRVKGAAQHRGYSISEIHMISISVKSCSSLQTVWQTMCNGILPFALVFDLLVRRRAAALQVCTQKGKICSRS